VRAADRALGRWYWRTFGRTAPRRHGLPASRAGHARYDGLGAARASPLPSAWRLWKYDPRYRHAATGRHKVSFIEPVRLFWRGELDGYVGRPLLRLPRGQGVRRGQH